MKKYILVFLSILYLGKSFSQVSNQLKIEIDSFVNTDEHLTFYRNMTYCERVNFIDSIISKNTFVVSKEKHIRYAIFDLCIYTNVKGKFDSSDSRFPLYNSNEKYLKVSRKIHRKLKCKR